MTFNENIFMLAGTAIAIFGVGLYIYDTRKDKVINAYNQYQYKQFGGSKKNKKNQKKTRKHRY